MTFDEYTATRRPYTLPRVDDDDDWMGNIAPIQYMFGEAVWFDRRGDTARRDARIDGIRLAVEEAWPAL